MNLPTSPILVEHFGCQKGSGEQVQALASCLYDVLNGAVIHGLIEPVLSNERILASEHLRTLVQMEWGQSAVPSVVLFDRGYPAAHLIAELESVGIKYAMRCSTEFLRNVRHSGSDCVVTHQFAAIRHTLRFRLIEVTLNNGETEYIATNLFDEGLTVQDFQRLYHLRWGIETSINTMKHKLLMEDFTGHTVDAVLQEFYAALTSINLIACIFYDNRELIEELQNKLLDIVTTQSARRRRRLFQILLADTRRNLVPVRSGRSFQRTVKHKSAHYHHNTKRA